LHNIEHSNILQQRCHYPSKTFS